MKKKIYLCIIISAVCLFPTVVFALTDTEIQDIIKDAPWRSDEYAFYNNSVTLSFNGETRYSWDRGLVKIGGGNYIVQNGKILCAPDEQADLRFSLQVEKIDTSLVAEYAMSSSVPLSPSGYSRFYRTEPALSAGLTRLYAGFEVTTVARESFSVWGVPEAHKKPSSDSHYEHIWGTPGSGFTVVLGWTVQNGQTWYLVNDAYFRDSKDYYSSTLVWIHGSAIYPSIIDRYYNYISERDYAHAYELWHKQASFEAFKGMYSDVKSCRILDIKRKDEITWRLIVQLELNDMSKKTYSVTMTVDDIHIVNSSSTLLY
ncbi:MAG: hypothetical protein EHM28_04660 [Spirochaetaceae bacterium]|nr:MAG: hypothetical protein EHM28_04660 [Spirochaetaceae bacterium]